MGVQDKSKPQAVDPDAGSGTPPAVAAPPVTEAKPGKPLAKRAVPFGLLAIVVGYGAYAGYRWVSHDRFFVSTDDAYVSADISQVAAKVPGYVESVAVKANQPVKAGDVIARLDDGDYRNAVAAARARIDSQSAAIDRIARQTAAAERQVDQAVAQGDAAQADLTRNTATLERQRQLIESKVASQSTLDQAQADFDRATAGLRGAEAAIAVARANVEVLKAQKVEAEKQGEELATALAKAERDLGFTVIRAPVDGVVGNRAVQPGNYVQTGARLLALVPLDGVRLDANFKETQLSQIRPGQAVEITVDAYPDEPITGTVESIAPGTGSIFSLLPPDNATGNFTKIIQRVPVRIAIPADVAQKGLLRPGLSITAAVDVRQ